MGFSQSKVVQKPKKVNIISTVGKCRLIHLCLIVFEMAAGVSLRSLFLVWFVTWEWGRTVSADCFFDAFHILKSHPGPSIFIHLHLPWLYHRIGWWEHFNRKALYSLYLMVKTHGFPVKIFPRKPSQWPYHQFGCRWMSQHVRATHSMTFERSFSKNGPRSRHDPTELHGMSDLEVS